MHKKVEFNGEQYWLHEDLLSPLDHFDSDGELLANPFSDISYAVIEDGKIKRYHQVIGTVDDLKDVVE